MSFNVDVGTEFEISFANRIDLIYNVTVICGLEVYSHKLKRITQIDVLAYIGNHIFVYEMKRFVTKLEGDFSSRSWIGTSKQRSYDIFNPIYQNSEHIRSLHCFFRKRGLVVEDYVWYNRVVVPAGCRILADSKYVVHDDYAISELYGVKGERNDKLFKSLFTGGVL